SDRKSPSASNSSACRVPTCNGGCPQRWSWSDWPGLPRPTRERCRAAKSSASPSRRCWRSSRHCWVSTRRPPTSIRSAKRGSSTRWWAWAPALLVFGEPPPGLDPLGKAAIFAGLAAWRQRGSTILLIEHETEAATRADRLLLMEDGRLVADEAPPRLLRAVPLPERPPLVGARLSD